MGFAGKYLSNLKGFSPHIIDLPSENLRYIVVIPVFCEPDLHKCLESLWNCRRSNGYAEVIMVFNSPVNAKEYIRETNKNTLQKTQRWISNHVDPSLRFFIIDERELPEKDAGAGLARKIGMDEAVWRFNTISRPGGYILSMDADSLCDPDYFTAVEDTVSHNPDIKGFDIYFEHPIEGIEYNEKIFQAIIEYELHLRYVNQMMRFSGFPYAHHTVGSCFGVRVDIYAAQGGMNKRKGGEDFYFLHKVIPLGHFVDINTTRVIPSPRESFRVPFGTGPAITKLLAEESELLTYNTECFLALQQLFNMIPLLFKAGSNQIHFLIGALPASLKEFLERSNFKTDLRGINDNCRTVDSFINRFYRWFNAFRIVKYLNYSSTNYYPKKPVTIAVRQFLKIKEWGNTQELELADAKELLETMRKIERNVK
jgi:hypothetical protein